MAKQLTLDTPIYILTIIFENIQRDEYFFNFELAVLREQELRIDKDIITDMSCSNIGNLFQDKY